MSEKVRNRRPCTTKVSGKNQVTLPVAALRAAHVAIGDKLRVEVDGDGRLLLIRETDPLDHVIGAFPGLSASADLEAERDAWEK
jgi:bifunctional DNA-binding transcriptional regulator/antitoxin component of YhaV-PrlF toxin-antitoxin module